jgi:hypothetical protein
MERTLEVAGTTLSQKQKPGDGKAEGGPTAAFVGLRRGQAVAIIELGRPRRLPRPKPSARCTIEEVLDRSCIPSAAASGEDAAPVELLGDPMHACHSLAADGFDHRHDAAHVTIRAGFHSRDSMGVPEAA